jgi:hypothetical protein
MDKNARKETKENKKCLVNILALPSMISIHF